MPTIADRLNLNAAMERLESCDYANWVQDCESLIGAFHGLPVTHGEMLLRRDGGTSEDFMSAHTKEAGEVPITFDPNQADGGIREYSLGATKERIGGFRVFRSGIGALAFHRFWASSLSTHGEEDGDPPQFEIRFNPRTLKLKAFGVLNVHKFRFSRFSIGFPRFQRILKPG